MPPTHDSLRTMWPSLTPTAPVNDELVTSLTDLRRSVENCRSVRGDIAPEFQRWVETSATQLSGKFEPVAVEALLRTRAYWETIGLSPSWPHVQTVVNHEIDAIASRLDGLIAELRRIQRSWSEPAHVAVIDTNVFIEHHEKFDWVKWHQAIDERPDRPVRLVVPLRAHAGFDWALMV